MELVAGLMKWRIFFLNIDKLSELRIAGSSLFHSETVEGKSFWKNYVLRLKRECCVHFLKYKTGRSLRGSRPNSWYSFSLDVPLVAPIIGKQALYEIDSSLSWKKLLKA